MAITLNESARAAIEKVLTEMVERGDPVFLPGEEPEALDIKAFTLTASSEPGYSREQVDEGAAFWGEVDREVDKERERREFIRRAAVAIKASYVHKQHDAPSVWKEARDLWDAKPEDC